MAILLFVKPALELDSNLLLRGLGLIYVKVIQVKSDRSSLTVDEHQQGL